jgi:DNA-binding NtrC family response regulator
VTGVPSTLSKKRILFLDQEAAILVGLQSLLREDRLRWEMVFVLGGPLELDAVRRQSFDVVVCELGAASAGGVALLAIKRELPAVAFIALSGHADRDAIARSVPTLRQRPSTPYDVATLRNAIVDAVTIDRAQAA